MEADQPAGGVTPMELVVAVVTSLVEDAVLLPETLAWRAEDMRRFGNFVERGFGVTQAASITEDHVLAFRSSPRLNGREPSAGTARARHFAISLLLSRGRVLGLIPFDPTLDLASPPRPTRLLTRALADDEIELGRCWAINSATSLRRPIAWALSEATAWTSEIGSARIEDADIDHLRVWLHGSSTKDSRWGYLTDWGAIQIERRLRKAKDLDPAAPLVAWRTPPKAGRAAASQAVKETLAAAGLNRDPAVRPRSIVAWRGRSLLAEGQDFAQVARALGYRSLDEAAAFVDFTWRSETEQ
jgi:integrase